MFKPYGKALGSRLKVEPLRMRLSAAGDFVYRVDRGYRDV